MGRGHCSGGARGWTVEGGWWSGEKGQRESLAMGLMYSRGSGREGEGITREALGTEEADSSVPP